MLSQRINILHDVFQHICESLCNQQCIFLYQSIANRKTGGGPGENREGTEVVIHTIWKYLKKPGGDRGRTGGGRDHSQYRYYFAKSTSIHPDQSLQHKSTFDQHGLSWKLEITIPIVFKKRKKDSKHWIGVRLCLCILAHVHPGNGG